MIQSWSWLFESRSRHTICEPLNMAEGLDARSFSTGAGTHDSRKGMMCLLERTREDRILISGDAEGGSV